jgi:hypothetical protein
MFNLKADRWSDSFFYIETHLHCTCYFVFQQCGGIHRARYYLVSDLFQTIYFRCLKPFPIIRNARTNPEYIRFEAFIVHKCAKIFSGDQQCQC